MTTPVATTLLPDMSEAELARAARVDSVLPTLASNALKADQEAMLPRENVDAMSAAGLLGINVPEAYGGLGGGLRDTAAATFALGTACPSTALAYFFSTSATSRGTLPIAAADAGLFDGVDETAVRAFGELVLDRMGRQGRWMANFASESVKTSKAAISISTAATPTDGGWLLNGVKAFGCGTGVADDYLVTATFPGGDTADFLGVFLVDPQADGVSERPPWDAVGMRGSASHGIILEDVFVPAEHALTVPGAFPKMISMSRGSFVGNQVAGTAVYVGAAKTVYDFAIEHLSTKTFKDTGEPIGTAPFQQQLVGEMRMHLTNALLWLREQLYLEATEPPPLPKEEVVAQWRIAKGSIAEAGFAVATTAVKACGTGNTANTGVVARGLRDLTMGLVQAFPPERGRMEAAAFTIKGAESRQFGTGG
jgi:alkylation response protein AidB-like acyl-CoA dehydrogenase